MVWCYAAECCFVLPKCKSKRKNQVNYFYEFYGENILDPFVISIWDENSSAIRKATEKFLGILFLAAFLFAIEGFYMGKYYLCQ